MTDHNLLPALSLTLLAGLSTVLGSVAALPGGRRQGRFLSLALAFSAGVRLYISMAEILPKARAALESCLPARRAAGAAAALFLLGALLMLLLEWLLPDSLPRGGKETSYGRAAALTALSIGLHNFPEGLVTFLTALQDPVSALPVAFAIAIHNLPEGVAVAVTVRQAGGSFRRALFLSVLSGLAEPAGGFLGWLLLGQLLPVSAAVGLLFAPVAGIMVYLSLFRLLPPALEQGEGGVLAVFGGMGLMALSLLLFL